MTQPDTALRLFCSACERHLPRGWFRRSGAGRRSSWCRECRKGIDTAHAAMRRGAGVSAVSPNLLRRKFLEQRGRCAECAGWLIWGEWHVDHEIPVSRGGRHEERNLRLTHPRCNLAKGSRIAGSR